MRKAIWSALCAALLLTGCGTDRVRYAEINARLALDRVAALTERVEELESQNEDLEARLEEVETRLGI